MCNFRKNPTHLFESRVFIFLLCLTKELLAKIGKAWGQKVKGKRDLILFRICKYVLYIAGSEESARAFSSRIEPSWTVLMRWGGVSTVAVDYTPATSREGGYSKTKRRLGDATPEDGKLVFTRTLAATSERIGLLV